MSAAEKVEERKLVPVMPARMQLAEAQRIVYHLTVDEHVIREDFLQPEFYTHIASQLQTTYRIEVTNDEQTFFGEYLVIDAGKNWATVEELRFVEFKKHHMEDGVKSDFEVKYKGPHHKWCVLRKADQEIVRSQMGKEQAYRSLSEFNKATNDNAPRIV